MNETRQSEVGGESENAATDAAAAAKEAGRKASATGREAAESPWMRALARAGLVARGVNYLLVGSLAMQVAFGSHKKQADTTGALRTVSRYPGGMIAMWLLAAGFGGLALWRFAETAYGQAGPAGRTKRYRFASLSLAVLYGFFCGAVVNFILGTGSSSSDAESKTVTARLLADSGGHVLIAAIGVGVAVTGVCVAIFGIRRRFGVNLRTAEMRDAVRKVVKGLGVVGYIARGLVFCVAGAFLVSAAVTFDPRKAQGLDGSLRKIAATPLGPWLLLAVALGLVIFGIYSWREARWRLIEPA